MNDSERQFNIAPVTEGSGVAENVNFDQLVMRQISRIDLLATNRAPTRDGSLQLNTSGEEAYQNAIDHLATSLRPIADDEYNKDIADLEVELEQKLDAANKTGYRKYLQGRSGTWIYQRAREDAAFDVCSLIATKKYQTLICLMDRCKLLFKHTGSSEL